MVDAVVAGAVEGRVTSRVQATVRDTAHTTAPITQHTRRHRRTCATVPTPAKRGGRRALLAMLVRVTALAGGQEIDGLAGFMVDLMDRMGLVGAALAVGLDNLFPPIPSEIVLPMAGLAASQGRFSLAGALFATTAGSVLGACFMYWLGRLFGRDRTEWIFARVPLLRIRDLEVTEAWFAKHGTKAVLFGRMVPIFRSLISIPAGIERMSFTVFVVLTTLGSLVWNSIFVGAGYTLGENWDVIEPYADWFQRLVILAVLLVVGWFVVMRVRELRDPRER